MNLKPVCVKYAYLNFKTTCVRCITVLDTRFDQVLADRDGCPFRSYFCEPCSKIVLPAEAANLATIARRLVHVNA